MEDDHQPHRPHTSDGRNQPKMYQTELVNNVLTTRFLSKFPCVKPAVTEGSSSELYIFYTQLVLVFDSNECLRCVNG